MLSLLGPSATYFAGVLVMAVSTGVSIFSVHVSMLTVFYGLLNGVGASLMVMVTATACQHFFVKNKGLSIAYFLVDWDRCLNIYPNNCKIWILSSFCSFRHRFCQMRRSYGHVRDAPNHPFCFGNLWMEGCLRDVCWTSVSTNLCGSHHSTPSRYLTFPVYQLYIITPPSPINLFKKVHVY